MEGMIVRSMAAGASQGAFSLWVAVTASIDDAIAAVRARMAEDDEDPFEVAVIKERVAEATVKKLGLSKGQVWRL